MKKPLPTAILLSSLSLFTLAACSQAPQKMMTNSGTNAEMMTETTMDGTTMQQDGMAGGSMTDHGMQEMSMSKEGMTNDAMMEKPAMTTTGSDAKMPMAPKMDDAATSDKK
ncbi:hypothetical protein GC163_09895 [bacterium]|nr:hypothetical protein [bacterium]